MRAASSLLSIEELSADDVNELLELARRFEAQVAPATPDGRFVAFLSDRESVRTRLAVHRAAGLLGSAAVDLDLASGFYADPARRSDHASFVGAELASMRVLGCSALVIRTHEHSILTEWRALTTLPLINGCSDEEHPLQVLSDALVMDRCFGRLEGLRLTLVGNGSSPVFRSHLFLAARLKIDVLLACPEGYEFPADLVERAGFDHGSIHSRDLAAALVRADVVCADSVAYRALTQAEEEAFAPYRLTSDTVARYAPDVHLMHCLPHADEIDSELVFADSSLMMQEVSARVPVTAAAIKWLSRDLRNEA